MDGIKYLNGILTVIAAIMVMILINQGGPVVGEAAVASAQPDGRSTGLVSAAEQRKQLIEEIKRIGLKLDRIDKSIEKGVDVKIVALPNMTDKNSQSDAQPNRAEARPQAPAE